MNKIQGLLRDFELVLKDFELPKEPEQLYRPMSYTIGNGGKRMRPLLVLLGCKLFNEDLTNAMHPALGMELFHNFSLIHDDIMDQAPIRRGMPSVYKKWNSNVAILSGDAMVIKAYEELIMTDERVALPILKLFNTTAIEVCEGQQLDMDFELRDDVTIDAYLNMIRLKTAVLLAACLKIGAMIGGASEKDAQLLYDFGLNSGIAFQLQDDILDAYGESSKVGKQQGGDIISNKKTFLLLKAKQLVNNEDLSKLNHLINGNHNDQDKVSAVLDLYHKLDVRKLAEAEMWSFFNKGVSCLNQVEGSAEWKQVLLAFSTQLMHREH